MDSERLEENQMKKQLEGWEIENRKRWTLGNEIQWCEDYQNLPKINAEIFG